MRIDWELTKEDFDKFLYWLDPDREKAGKKYEDIRRHLIIILTGRGCSEAEDLADETINRVIRRAQQMADTYHGEPAPYFIAVANNLYLEYVAKCRKMSELPTDVPVTPAPDPDEDREYNCLDRCMQKLNAANRDLLLQYYLEDKQAKIDNRKKLADKIGIAPNALRIRAHRIRIVLQQCIDECLTSAPVM